MIIESIRWFICTYFLDISKLDEEDHNQSSEILWNPKNPQLPKHFREAEFRKLNGCERRRFGQFFLLKIKQKIILHFSASQKMAKK